MNQSGVATARRGLGPRLQGGLLKIGGLVALLVVWQIVTATLGVPSYILPEPSQLGPGLLQDRNQIFDGLRPLLVQSALGFAFGNALGIVLAALVNRFATVRVAVMPVALAIRSIPIVAITPLITLILGFGLQTTVTVATLITFFPALINMVRGLAAVDREALQLFKALDADEATVFWKLRWPSAMPYLFSALKVTAPAAILGATVAEYIASNSGLGYMIQNASTNFQYRLMWEATIVTTATVIVAFAVVSWLETMVVRWAPER
jgi:NitT/TauT family transport system permease protein